MNRQGHETADFFEGIEVEHTPAFGLETLFVIGVQPVEFIRDQLNTRHKHIFFGANHSYDPKSDDYSAEYFEEWEAMILPFVKEGMFCTLDIPIDCAEEFLEGPLVEYSTFIPQLRIPLPYIQQWNYNTMLKIDDKDFNATNPGVWCHRLHDLQDSSVYTDWSKYKDDETL